jgi:hypothetical protein
MRAEILHAFEEYTSNTNDENGGKFWPKSRFPQPGR